MKWRVLISSLCMLVLVNILAQHWILRWDMTDDHRYSLSAPTKALLCQLDAPVKVTLLLDGELNSGFLRLRKATKELIEEMSIYSSASVDLVCDSESIPQGVLPIVIHERTHKGQTAQTTVYPYAVVQYKDKQTIVELLRNSRGLSGEENLNLSIENLEYAFVESFRRLMQTQVEKIAFLEGHGELPEENVYEISQSLAHYYQIDRGVLGNEDSVLDGYRVVIIADPQRPFSDQDKYILDQYLMRGGRIFWLLSGVQFSTERLSSQGTTPIVPLDLNLTDMLFRYGVRVNPSVVQDLQCLPVPVDVSADPAQPNWQPMPWTYAPLLLTSQSSSITRGLMQVSVTMPSCIEFVGGDDGLRKEVLLATSSASKLTPAPAEIDLSLVTDNESEFRYSFIPVAAAIEGTFSSLFSYRMPPIGMIVHTPLRKRSLLTKQVVVASGSVIRNEWQNGRPIPLGYDRYTHTQFGNSDFIVNAVLYLADDIGWMSLRQKEVTLRLLNNRRACEQRVKAQMISIAMPLVLLAVMGGIVLRTRKHQYTKRQ